MNNTGFWGLVEGFYGMPWNARQRHRLFQWLSQTGCNTYLYAPKDDLKHRFQWRELYDEAQAPEISALIHDCRRHGLHFIYALSPGLDIRYKDSSDLAVIQNRFTQLLEAGCTDFALLFDDLPAATQSSSREGFAALAQDQALVSNQILRWLKTEAPNARLIFCPTEYCSSMAAPSVLESSYLATLGRTLDPAIPVLWTGKAIISEVITSEMLADVTRVLGRKVIIWDNLYANDYDSRRLYLGPYLGRNCDLKNSVDGILLNPNCQFEANYLPIHSFGTYLKGAGGSPTESFGELLRNWLTIINPDPTEQLDVEDLELLVSAFYLPFQDGEPTGTFLRNLSTLASGIEDEKAMESVISYCADIRMLVDRLSRVRNRDLMLAIYRHVWDLREETFYIEQRMRQRGLNREAHVPGYSEFHPRLFRGGLVSQIQTILPHPPHGPS